MCSASLKTLPFSVQGKRKGNGVVLMLVCILPHLCRVQQLQLLVKGVSGEELKQLWHQLYTEISLQKNKRLLLAYRARDRRLDELVALSTPCGDKQLRQKVLEFAAQRNLGVPEGRHIRKVLILKKETESLGMSITVRIIVIVTYDIFWRKPIGLCPWSSFFFHTHNVTCISLEGVYGSESCTILFPLKHTFCLLPKSNFSVYGQ